MIDNTSSPLVAIERAAQSRAKELALDVGRTSDRTRLRELVDDEIVRWNDHHRRGEHRFPIGDPLQLADRATRNLTGYGPLEPLIADDGVWEIMVNAPDSIFVKRHRVSREAHGERRTRDTGDRPSRRNC